MTLDLPAFEFLRQFLNFNTENEQKFCLSKFYDQTVNFYFSENIIATKLCEYITNYAGSHILISYILLPLSNSMAKRPKLAVRSSLGNYSNKRQSSFHLSDLREKLSPNGFQLSLLSNLLLRKIAIQLGNS